MWVGWVLWRWRWVWVRRWRRCRWRRPTPRGHRGHRVRRRRIVRVLLRVGGRGLRRGRGLRSRVGVRVLRRRVIRGARVTRRALRIPVRVVAGRLVAGLRRVRRGRRWPRVGVIRMRLGRWRFHRRVRLRMVLLRRGLRRMWWCRGPPRWWRVLRRRCWRRRWGRFRRLVRGWWCRVRIRVLLRCRWLWRLRRRRRWRRRRCVVWRGRWCRGWPVVGVRVLRRRGR